MFLNLKQPRFSLKMKVNKGNKKYSHLDIFSSFKLLNSISMIDFFELKRKIEKQPCLINSINDEYSTIEVSNHDFRFEYFNDIIFFSYIENRNFYLNDLTYSDSRKWFKEYIFSTTDLKNAKIYINNSNTINVFFKNKISLNIVNKLSGYKHDTLFVNKIPLSFFTIEDTLDVFNLFKNMTN